MSPRYTQDERKDLIGRVCALIVQTSVANACKQVGISKDAFFVWLAADDDLADQYVRARKAIAFKDEEEIEEIAQIVRAGEIDPQAARVAIDAKKWLAGKRHPKVYGDKVQQEVSGPGGGPVQTEDLTAVKAASTESLKAALAVLKDANQKQEK